MAIVPGIPKTSNPNRGLRETCLEHDGDSGGNDSGHETKTAHGSLPG